MMTPELRWPLGKASRGIEGAGESGEPELSDPSQPCKLAAVLSAVPALPGIQGVNCIVTDAHIIICGLYLYKPSNS